MRTTVKDDKRPAKKLVTLEASPEWIEWVDGVAEKIGLSRSATIDQAMRRLAMHLRCKSLPPKR